MCNGVCSFVSAGAEAGPVVEIDNTETAAAIYDAVAAENFYADGVGQSAGLAVQAVGAEGVTAFGRVQAVPAKKAVADAIELDQIAFDVCTCYTRVYSFSAPLDFSSDQLLLVVAIDHVGVFLCQCIASL